MQGIVGQPSQLRGLVATLTADDLVDIVLGDITDADRLHHPEPADRGGEFLERIVLDGAAAAPGRDGCDRG